MGLDAGVRREAANLLPIRCRRPTLRERSAEAARQGTRSRPPSAHLHHSAEAVAAELLRRRQEVAGCRGGAGSGQRLGCLPQHATYPGATASPLLSSVNPGRPPLLLRSMRVRVRRQAQPQRAHLRS